MIYLTVSSHSIVHNIHPAQSQILIGDMQKRLEASANQLLLAYTPFVIPMLLVVSRLDLELPANNGEGYNAYHIW